MGSPAPGCRRRSAGRRGPHGQDRPPHRRRPAARLRARADRARAPAALGLEPARARRPRAGGAELPQSPRPAGPRRRPDLRRHRHGRRARPAQDAHPQPRRGGRLPRRGGVDLHGHAQPGAQGALPRGTDPDADRPAVPRGDVRPDRRRAGQGRVDLRHRQGAPAAQREDGRHHAGVERDPQGAAAARACRAHLHAARRPARALRQVRAHPREDRRSRAPLAHAHDDADEDVPADLAAAGQGLEPRARDHRGHAQAPEFRERGRGRHHRSGREGARPARPVRADAPGRLHVNDAPADEPVARAVARGTGRLLARMGWTPLAEFPLASGRRADLLALSGDSQILVVEIKSSAADFRADRKWTEYLEWCDLFAFAVPAQFPVALLPPDSGLIVADSYDAALVREFQVQPKLVPARRKALVLRFAKLAGQRLHRIADPEGIF
ncbi:MAG: MmcB family DNA repair protein [Proteobacteria bacterium]|nr:MmcB family DNA repair protein [Pseudomonadota bacterium]